MSTYCTIPSMNTSETGESNLWGRNHRCVCGGGGEWEGRFRGDTREFSGEKCSIVLIVAFWLQIYTLIQTQLFVDPWFHCK